MIRNGAGLAIILVAIFTVVGVARAQELQYRLKVPKGWDYWVLAETANSARSCYTFADDRNTKEYVEEKTAAGGMKTYKLGAIAAIVESATETGSPKPFAYSVEVISGEDKGKQGWISAELVELTAESKKIKAKRDAAAAERRKQAEAEREKRYAEERAQLRTFCGRVYKDTIDKKVGDLTVRETEDIRACRAAGLYPP